MLFKQSRRITVAASGLLAFTFCFAGGAFAQTQTFNSGSTGADGALNYSTPGTYYFDPKSFTPPLNPAGDNIFNFTTITIASGVTLKLSSKLLSGPVYWLASGAVTISGALDLSGEMGHPASTLTSVRIPAPGGAGGYAGGLGGSQSPGPTPGNGPGGGTAPSTSPQALGKAGGNASFTGNQYLIPLVGGSGGGGGSFGDPVTFGAGGGGGGGAILIASSVSISYGGTIQALGGGPSNIATCGGGCPGGYGSGGSIRLVAPIISDKAPGDGGCGSTTGANGYLRVGGGPTVSGLIRLEAFTLNVNPCATGNIMYSIPFGLALPATPPSSLNVTSINGIPINANPFSFPDAVINSAGPVTVNVQAHFIPIGTVPKLIVFSDSGPDQTITCTPLQGTLQSSTSTASITFPSGGSRGFVKATWQ